jgi:hypothetical protein
MFTRTRWLLPLAVLACSAGWAQNNLDSRSTLHITFPEDSPVTVLSADWGESSATARGGAMLLDLHTSLSLRNSGTKKIRGVTLLVLAQEVTPGGKASVSVPSLNVAPGDVFPIRIDLRLLRPLQQGSGPLVQIGLDGVLFDDLNFYGPNKLNSRRSMTVWEIEARGPIAVQEEIMASLERQGQRATMDARVSQGPATNTQIERQVQFAFLRDSESPLAATNALARVAGDEIRVPQISVYNRQSRPVRAFEIGYLVKDQRGKEFVSGAIPLDVALGPKQGTKVVQDTVFKFAEANGRPIAIDSVRAYVTSVEFADGAMWVPSDVSTLPTPSPEEQRLTELYKKRGLNALVEELRKF